MESYLPIFVVGGFIMLFVAIIVVSTVSAKKRREAIRAVGDELGMDFQPEECSPETFGLEQLPIMNRGGRRRIYNVLDGNLADVRTLLFDYRYTTGSGKNRTTHYFTIAAFAVPGGDLPAFQCEPEHFFHGIAEMFGFHDIDFDRFPVFSKAYRLKGDNEPAIRELFHDDALRWFEQRREVKWYIQGAADWLLVTKQRGHLKPSAWPQFYLDAAEVHNLLTLPWQQRHR